MSWFIKAAPCTLVTLLKLNFFIKAFQEFGMVFKQFRNAVYNL